MENKNSFISNCAIITQAITAGATVLSVLYDILLLFEKKDDENKK